MPDILEESEIDLKNIDSPMDDKSLLRLDDKAMNETFTKLNQNNE